MRDLILFLVLICLVSCDLMKIEKGSNKKILARLDKEVLMIKDFKGKMPENLSKQDSISFFKDAIASWASEKLFFEKAELNLGGDVAKEISIKVENYRKTLYVDYYKQFLVGKTIDTVVAKSEIVSYYESRKSTLSLSDDIIKLRYIHIGRDNKNYTAFKKMITRYNSQDKKDLLSQSLSLTPFFLNDSLWIKARYVYSEIADLQNFDFSKMPKGNIIEVLDKNGGIYIVRVVGFLRKGEIAPVDYLLPTLKKLIMNQRTSRFLKQIQKDIIQDAIKKKHLEIYYE